MIQIKLSGGKYEARPLNDKGRQFVTEFAASHLPERGPDGCIIIDSRFLAGFLDAAKEGEIGVDWS